MPRPPNDHHAIPNHPFATNDDLEHFLTLVRARLPQLGIDVVNFDARLRGGTRLGETAALQLGLLNLAQECAQRPRWQWPQQVDTYIARSDPHTVQPQIEQLGNAPFAVIETRLAVRIHPADYLRGIEHQVVHRVDLEGTVTLLVMDLPQSMLAVPTPFAKSWGVPDEQLFRRALDNLATLAPANWQPMPLPPTMHIDALVCGHDYTASHVLRGDAGLPSAGRHGSLLAIPHRQVALHHAIDGDRLGASVQGLQRMAEGMFREGPGSISPHLFWRRPDGRFERQRNVRSGSTSRLVATPDFARLLAGKRSS